MKKKIEQRRWRLCEDEIDRMIELRKQGLTYYAIGKIINCTDVAVAIALKRHGFESDRIGCWTDEDNRRLVELWQSGAKRKVIAKELGRTGDAITMHVCVLRKQGYDLPIRYRGYERNRASVSE